MEIKTELCNKGGPKVSVGIPFFNAEATLADAIRSVFAQTFQDWELILVDDGSKDGSLDIARWVRDPRVRVLSDGVNRQLSYRLNQIASEARAPLLARMDADDLMHPRRLESQVHYLISHPRVDVVGTGALVLDENDCPIAKRESHSVPGDFKLCRSFFFHPTVMGKREWFIKNPYDARYHRAEDRELWCRTWRRSAFAYLAEWLYFYRDYASFSLKNYKDTSLMNVAICWRYGPELVGPFGTCYYSAREFLKIPVYGLAKVMGLHGRLIKRRSLPLMPEEKAEAEQALQTIKATPVPLMDGRIWQTA